MRRFMATASLGVCAGVITAAGLAAPARADAIDTSFLSALGGAGLPVGDPAATAELGQSVCPMITEPAGTAARARDGVRHDSRVDRRGAALR